jgi:hypothetical protein
MIQFFETLMVAHLTNEMDGRKILLWNYHGGSWEVHVYGITDELCGWIWCVSYIDFADMVITACTFHGKPDKVVKIGV